MLMIALTVDHEIPETFARIMMPSERLSTIIFSAIDTGTLASAAIAALASSNLPASAKCGKLMLVEPAVLVQRFDQRVGDGRFPCDGRGRRARLSRCLLHRARHLPCCCGLAASSRARTVTEAFAINLRYRWRGIVG